MRLCQVSVKSISENVNVCDNIETIIAVYKYIIKSNVAMLIWLWLRELFFFFLLLQAFAGRTIFISIYFRVDHTEHTLNYSSASVSVCVCLSVVHLFHLVLYILKGITHKHTTFYDKRRK